MIEDMTAMPTRRTFLGTATLGAATAAWFAVARDTLTHRERLDRALKGDDVDRPPFTFWYHFGLEKDGPEAHARATLDFHRRYHTDLVKVMSDFPYPGAVSLDQLRVQASPFPAQLKALALIRDGLGGNARFVETIFNPWNVAEKLTSKEELLRLKRERPQVLLDALDVIARSEANHARLAVQTGASGIFLAIANAQPEVLSREEYAKFSEPFDRLVLDAVKGAPLNVLHLHGDRVYLDHFHRPWPARAINYSAHGTAVPLATVRRDYAGVLMGGIDERSYRTLNEAQVTTQWQEAQRAAGKRFILAPGCSVPNESQPAELERLPRQLGVKVG